MLVHTLEITNTADISSKSVHMILHRHEYHTYKVQTHQELMSKDFARGQKIDNKNPHRIQQTQA